MARSVTPAAGAVIVVGMRWADRVIGVLSTIILARLLTPEDFGIIAMASIVIGLIDVLLDVGVNVALVQNRNATQGDYDAAWTLRLIQSLLAAALVLAVAGPAAEYFRDPRVTYVIQALALTLILSACENIGVVSFQKNMEFGVEARFLLARRLAGFFIAIGGAWYLQSYWALVIGAFGGRAVGVALSYAMHPMRPRISLARMGPLLSFSSWNLLRGIAGYLNENLHRFVVGGRESTATMGHYSMGSDIAALPSTELLAPLSRVLFPMFVDRKEDLASLKRAFLLALGIQALVGIPAGIGLALVANDVVLALLGEQWHAAVPFVQIMGIVNIVIAIGVSGAYMLLALGHARTIAWAAWIPVLVFTALAMLAIPDGDASAVAMLRLGVVAFALIIILHLAKRELPALRAMEMVASIWRPLIASAAMAAVLLALPSLAGAPMLVQLFIKVAAGAAVCAGTVLALWRVAGCPDGAEAYLLETMRLDAAMRRLLRQAPRER